MSPINQWGFDVATYNQARNSTDSKELESLAVHSNSYIRACVATNKHLSSQTVTALLHDSSEGVIMHALENSNITRTQFTELFERYMQKPYSELLHPTLAEHPLASIENLQVLLQRGKWSITLNVLNNHRGRDTTVFRNLIATIVRLHNSTDESEKILGRLAYKRTYGHYPYKESD
ncbi:MAG: hypothetical protein ACI9H6_000465 [Patiriisocius sp.]|jgi:hypothetical protein